MPGCNTERVERNPLLPQQAGHTCNIVLVDPPLSLRPAIAFHPTHDRQHHYINCRGDRLALQDPKGQRKTSLEPTAHRAGVCLKRILPYHLALGPVVRPAMLSSVPA